MRAALLVPCAFVLLALRPLPAVAQVDTFLGQKVGAVRVAMGGETIRDPDLENVLETRPGDALSAAGVRESIIHLMALGRFDDVQVFAERQPTGLVVTYEVRPLRTVRSLGFRGHLGLDQSRLRTEIADRYGSTPPVSRSRDIGETLKELYRAHGYADAAITPRPTLGPSPNEATLTFEIEAGAQPRIDAVRFLDTDPKIDQAELQRQLRLRAGLPYDPADLEQRRASYTDALRSRGFYKATIAVAPQAAPNGNVTMEVTGVRGPRVAVQLAGDPVPGGRLEDLVPLRRENAVDDDLVEDWSGNIERFLRVEGYRDAKVTPESREAGDQLRYVFNVRRGMQYLIDNITVQGSEAVPIPKVLEALAPLKVVKGQPFAERTVQAAVDRLVSEYRGKGFTSASAKPEYEMRPGRGTVHVDITVRVSEGQQTLIDSVQFAGNEQVPEADLVRLVKSKAGTPFVVSTLDEDRDEIMRLYLDRGYQLAAVELPDPAQMMSADKTRAAVRFVIHEGPQVLIDHVLIVGNTRTSGSTIRSALQLVPGQPLGLENLLEGQRRVAALGLFRRVQVSQLPRGSEARRDVLVTVQEAPATTIAYGGGLEGAKRQRNVNGTPVSAVDIAPRGLFEIGRRNLWGKNRAISFNGSFAVRPESVGVVGTGLREYRALGAYREPHILRLPVDFLVTGGIEQAVRPAYSFNRRGIRAEVVRPLSKTMTFVTRYALDRTRVINPAQNNPQDVILLERLFPTVRLSKVSSSLVRDTRSEDPVDPDSGMLTSVDGEIAPPLLGSEVGVAKTLLQAFAYRKLPTKRRVVFAGGVRIGFVTGYGTTPAGPVLAPPLSERFFAGGNTTVRGVAEDTLGTPATFVSGFATGGGGLVILNAELRTSIWKSLAAVTFIDAGNVYELASKTRPTDLQPAVGFGLRYKSPIGPIRVDLGFNLDRRVLGTQRESLTVISFGIGQAF